MKFNLTELPHQFLLRKYSLTQEVLGNDGKQMIKDLEQTIRVIAAKSKSGAEINLSPSTQQKISTYDRYICDSIFQYLEEKDAITENQADAEENQMDDKREILEEKMEALQEEQEQQQEQQQEQPQEQEQEQEQEEVIAKKQEEVIAKEEQQPETKAKIGFWDWE